MTALDFIVTSCNCSVSARKEYYLYLNSTVTMIYCEYTDQVFKGRCFNSHHRLNTDLEVMEFQRLNSENEHSSACSVKQL